MDWKIANITSMYNKGQKGDPGKYTPDLGAREGHGADHLEYHHKTHQTTRVSGSAIMAL